MNFNYNTFSSTLDTYDDVDVKHSSTNNGWFYKDSKDDSDFNLVVEYSYDDDHNYRTWRQELTTMEGNSGMLVSTKIDHIRGDNQDDHLILMACYNAVGVICYAQAFVQMKNEDPIQTDVITTGDIPDQIHDQIQAHIKDDYGINGSTDGRKKIPHIAKVNLYSMAAAVSV